MSSANLTVVALPMLLTGCVLGAHAGVSPSVDTNGNVGAQVVVGGLYGIELDTKERGVGVTAGGTVGVGTMGATAEYELGVDYIDTAELPWRAGLRVGLGTRLDGDADFATAGASVAAFPRAKALRGRLRALGVEARVQWLASSGSQDAMRLCIGIIYELHSHHELKVIP